MSAGAGGQAALVQDMAFRACCGKLRWELLEIVEGLVGQDARLKALRWGTREVPLDISVDARPAEEVVETMLVEAARFLGASSSCFTGGGSLIVERRAGAAAQRR